MFKLLIYKLYDLLILKLSSILLKTNRRKRKRYGLWCVGSANVVQRDAFDYLDSPIIKVNSADVPMPYSSSLEKLYLPQVDDIIEAAKKVTYIK